MRISAVVLLTFALGSNSAAAGAPEPPRAPSLADLAWLAGSWRGESAGTREEEHWLAPAGGLMLGLHRDVPPSGAASFEYLRIEERGSRIVLQGSPSGAPPTPFALAEWGPARAVFENPEHDFPKRIIYSREGDVLTARVEGDGGKGMEWRWTRSVFSP